MDHDTLVGLVTFGVICLIFASGVSAAMRAARRRLDGLVSVPPAATRGRTLVRPSPVGRSNAVPPTAPPRPQRPAPPRAAQAAPGQPRRSGALLRTFHSEPALVRSIIVAEALAPPLALRPPGSR